MCDFFHLACAIKELLLISLVSNDLVNFYVLFDCIQDIELQ